MNGMTMGRGDSRLNGAGPTRWGAVEYRTSDGDRVVARRCRLPAGFADLVEKDMTGLRRKAAELTAAVGGALIDASWVTVAGRSAVRRVERLPPECLPGVRYAATLIVFLDDALGVEITVTCADSGSAPRDGGHDALARAWRLVADLTLMIRFPALTARP